MPDQPKKSTSQENIDFAIEVNGEIQNISFTLNSIEEENIFQDAERIYFSLYEEMLLILVNEQSENSPGKDAAEVSQESIFQAAVEELKIAIGNMTAAYVALKEGREIPPDVPSIYLNENVPIENYPKAIYTYLCAYMIASEKMEECNSKTEATTTSTSSTHQPDDTITLSSTAEPQETFTEPVIEPSMADSSPHIILIDLKNVTPDQLRNQIPYDDDAPHLQDATIAAICALVGINFAYSGAADLGPL